MHYEGRGVYRLRVLGSKLAALIDMDELSYVLGSRAR
jgi:hypothetical protein